MAVKKTDIVAELAEDNSVAVEQEAPAKADPIAEKAVATKAPKLDNAECCVYLGPTIHGVIQSGTVYSGNRKSTEAFLAPAITKYPLIAKLIVTDKTLAYDRVKVKTAGNALNVFYKKLLGKTV